MAEIHPIPATHPLIQPVKIQPDEQRRRPPPPHPASDEDSATPPPASESDEPGHIDAIV